MLRLDEMTGFRSVNNGDGHFTFFGERNESLHMGVGWETFLLPPCTFAHKIHFKWLALGLGLKQRRRSTDKFIRLPTKFPKEAPFGLTTQLSQQISSTFKPQLVI